MEYSNKFIKPTTMNSYIFPGLYNDVQRTIKRHNRYRPLFMSIIFLLLSISIKAQINFSAGTGYSSKDFPAIYNLGVGYELGSLNINGDFRTSLIRDPSSHTYAGGTVGINIVTLDNSYMIIPAIGYYSSAYTSDQKIFDNRGRFAYSLKGEYSITREGWLYGNIFYINKVIQFTIGGIIKLKDL